MISLIADTHFQDDRPISRKDDYYQAQMRKFHWCLQQAPVMLHAGDFFHRPRCSHKLLYDLIHLIRESGTEILVVPGQHDLIGHNLESICRTPLGVLAEAGVVRLLLNQKERIRVRNNGKLYELYVYPAPFGCDWPEDPQGGEYSILLIHRLILGPNKEGFFLGMVADDAHKLLSNSLFNLIVSGDNHTTFTFVSPRGNRIFNPGSMMRRTKDQADHRPCLGLVEPWNNSFRSIPIPVEQDVFHDVDQTDLVEHNPMLERLIQELRVASCGDSIDSFADRLRLALDAGHVSNEVREIIYKSLGKEEGRL